MAYTPKEWVCGETITAEALNHMEQGIADCGSRGTESKRIINITAEDLVACADANNIVNEFDLIEYAVKKRIGVVPNTGNSRYLIAYEFFVETGSALKSYSISVADVTFMGPDTSTTTFIAAIFTFDGVVTSISKASALPQYVPTATVNGVVYKFIPMNSTYDNYVVQGQLNQ